MVAGAAACVAAAAVLLGLAYYVPQARWLDGAALDGFGAAWRPGIVNGVAQGLAHVCNPAPYALAAIGVIAAAFALRGLRTGAAVGLLLAGANLSSQTLKPLLGHHRELYYTHWHLNNIADASYPSGHATAAMAISLAVLMIVPKAFRPLAAALGAAFTIAVAFSIVMLGWHFPSDVVGGFLVATAWGLTAMAALRYANERWPQKGSMRQAARAAVPAPSPAAIALTVLALVAIAALAAATQAGRVASFADRHTAFVAVAGAIAVAATLLLAAAASLAGLRSSSNGSSG
jgi:membrane-associated phospholipid phosphatase